MQTFVGRTIGPYQLLEEIGRGGMGVVYKAWQPSLNRFVVLKMLPESLLLDPKFLDRFQREARVVARLSHPNIVAIYDAGAVGGLHYIAMEYMDGGTLEDRLMAGPLSLDAAQKILTQVASALDYAHAQGLIHRDIKPSNILFTSDGWVKVADSGIARPAESTRLTRTGVLLGTPEYMSPEQATGDAVDHRTDLYALGVVAYEMLTGRVPFQGTTPYAVLHAAIYQAPPSPREINPPVSRRRIGAAEGFGQASGSALSVRQDIGRSVAQGRAGDKRPRVSSCTQADSEASAHPFVGPASHCPVGYSLRRRSRHAGLAFVLTEWLRKETGHDHDSGRRTRAPDDYHRHPGGQQQRRGGPPGHQR